MRITITGKHTKITEALREYARKKIEKLEKYFDGIVSCRAVLNVERKRQTIEIELHVVKGGMIIAISESEDLYRSVDTATDKLQRQLKKYKGKLRQKRRAGQQSVRLSDS